MRDPLTVAPGHRLRLDKTPRRQRVRCDCGWKWTSRAKHPDVTAAINWHLEDVEADTLTQRDAAQALKGTA